MVRLAATTLALFVAASCLVSTQPKPLPASLVHEARRVALANPKLRELERKRRVESIRKLASQVRRVENNNNGQQQQQQQQYQGQNYNNWYGASGGNNNFDQYFMSNWNWDEGMGEQGFGFDITKYSLKFTQCATVQTWSDFLAEDENTETVLAAQRYALFRLCPSDSCSGSNFNGCSSDYGEYLVGLDQYLVGKLAAQEDRAAAYCQYCEQCGTVEASKAFWNQVDVKRVAALYQAQTAYESWYASNAQTYNQNNNQNQNNGQNNGNQNNKNNANNQYQYDQYYEAANQYNQANQANSNADLQIEMDYYKYLRNKNSNNYVNNYYQSNYGNGNGNKNSNYQYQNNGYGGYSGGLAQGYAGNNEMYWMIQQNNQHYQNQQQQWNQIGFYGKKLLNGYYDNTGAFNPAWGYFNSKGMYIILGAYGVDYSNYQSNGKNNYKGNGNNNGNAQGNGMYYDPNYAANNGQNNNGQNNNNNNNNNKNNQNQYNYQNNNNQYYQNQNGNNEQYYENRYQYNEYMQQMSELNVYYEMYFVDGWPMVWDQELFGDLPMGWYDLTPESESCSYQYASNCYDQYDACMQLLYQGLYQNNANPYSYYGKYNQEYQMQQQSQSAYYGGSYNQQNNQNNYNQDEQMTNEEKQMHAQWIYGASGAMTLLSFVQCTPVDYNPTTNWQEMQSKYASQYETRQNYIQNLYHTYACEDDDEYCQKQLEYALRKYEYKQQLDNEKAQVRSYYIGPHCSSNGREMTLAVYEDMYCSLLDENTTVTDVLGYDPLGELSLESDECIKCGLSESDLYQNMLYEFEEVNTDQSATTGLIIDPVCSMLYQLSGKCNKNLAVQPYFNYQYEGEDQSQNAADAWEQMYQSEAQAMNEDAVCAFIESLKSNTYNEKGEVVLNGGDVWRKPTKWNREYSAQSKAMTPGMKTALTLMSLACLFMGIWACFLHGTLARKNIPWRPMIGLRNKGQDPTDIARQNSGILMGRSRSGPGLPPII